MSRPQVLLWIFKRRCLGYKELIVSPPFLNKGFKLSAIATTILLLICPLAAALFSARRLSVVLFTQPTAFSPSPPVLADRWHLASGDDPCVWLPHLLCVCVSVTNSVYSKPVGSLRVLHVAWRGNGQRKWGAIRGRDGGGERKKKKTGNAERESQRHLS